MADDTPNTAAPVDDNAVKGLIKSVGKLTRFLVTIHKHQEQEVSAASGFEARGRFRNAGKKIGGGRTFVKRMETESKKKKVPDDVKGDKKPKKDAKDAKKKKKRLPLHMLVHERHLDMEPLCCLSSCLIRSGCFATGLFQVLMVLVFCVCCVARLRELGWWAPIPDSLGSFLHHPLPIYIFLLFNGIWSLGIFALFRGLNLFHRRLLRVFMAVEVLAVVVSVASLAGTIYVVVALRQPIGWVEIVLVCTFLSGIVLQVWSFFVVKDCIDFFKMCSVLVSMGER